MVVCCYTRGKVLRPLGDDTFRTAHFLRHACTPDTVTDTYASNNDIRLSTFLLLDWRLVKDSPTWEELASTNTLT